MSVLVPFNGSAYLVPTQGETSWGTQVTSLLTDLGNNAIPKANAVITNGSIDGVDIGAATPGTGHFIDLDSAGNLTAINLSVSASATAPTVAAGTNTTAVATTAFTTTQIAGKETKNAVINGDMAIWQRGTSIVPAPSTPVYTADRFRCGHDGTGGTTTVSQVTPSGAAWIDLGLRYAMSYAVSVAPTGSPTFRQIITHIEDVETFAARTVTISVYASVASGTLSVNLGGFQNFGTGGSPAATVNLTGTTMSVTTTPTRFSYTATLGSVQGKTPGSNGNDYLGIVISPPLTGTYTLFLTGLQVELGSVATPFQYTPVGEQLTNCQRYFQSAGFNYGTLGGVSTAMVYTQSLVQQMRATPTVSANFTTQTNCGTSASAALNPAQVLISTVSTAAGGTSLIGTFTAAAELV